MGWSLCCGRLEESFPCTFGALSLLHVCGDHQEVSPGWAACQFLWAVVTKHHNLGCLKHPNNSAGLKCPKSRSQQPMLLEPVVGGPLAPSSPLVGAGNLCGSLQLHSSSLCLCCQMALCLAWLSFHEDTGYIRQGGPSYSSTTSS